MKSTNTYPPKSVTSNDQFFKDVTQLAKRMQDIADRRDTFGALGMTLYLADWEPHSGSLQKWIRPYAVDISAIANFELESFKKGAGTIAYDPAGQPEIIFLEVGDPIPALEELRAQFCMMLDAVAEKPGMRVWG